MRGGKPELGELDTTVPADVAVAAVKGVLEAADAGAACSELRVSDIGGMGDAAERDHISVPPVTAVAVDVSAVSAGAVGEVSADGAADADNCIVLETGVNPKRLAFENVVRSDSVTPVLVDAGERAVLVDGLDAVDSGLLVVVSR